MCKQRLLLSSTDVGVRCILILIRFSQSVQSQHYPVRGFSVLDWCGSGWWCSGGLVEFDEIWMKLLASKYFPSQRSHRTAADVAAVHSSCLSHSFFLPFQEPNLITVKRMQARRIKKISGALVKTKIFQLRLVWYFHFAPLSAVTFLFFVWIPLGEELLQSWSPLFAFSDKCAWINPLAVFEIMISELLSELFFLFCLQRTQGTCSGYEPVVHISDIPDVERAISRTNSQLASEWPWRRKCRGTLTRQTKRESAHELPATANEVSCEVSFSRLLMRDRKRHILKLMASAERHVRGGCKTSGV